MYMQFEDFGINLCINPSKILTSRKRDNTKNNAMPLKYKPQIWFRNVLSILSHTCGMWYYQSLPRHLVQLLCHLGTNFGI